MESKDTEIMYKMYESIREATLSGENSPVRDNKEGDKNMTQEKNQEVGKEQEKKERKIYLSLPPMSKETFEKRINELKENGARFDGYSKAWYITPEADFNKFKNYLGVPYEYINEKAKELRARENEKKSEKSQEDRESVKDKLGKNKEALDKNAPEKKEPEHSRDEAR
ncbi:MAG: hypothetical protein ACI4V0_07900 [Lachnospiraceae bacterium]